MIDHRGKSTYRVYKCKELAESLQQALAIDVKDESTATHPECVCKPFKLTIVYAHGIGVPKKHIIPFQWNTHKAEGCTVRNKVKINNYTHVEICNIRQLCEHFQKTSKGGANGEVDSSNWCLAKHTYPCHCTSYCNRSWLSRAPDNLSCPSKLECPLCFEILSQSIELPCSVLVCAKCIITWLKVAGTVLCPCCHSAVPPASLRPASDLIILLLNDILVQCTSCGRNMRTGAFVGHKCTSSLTRSEANMAGDVLRHVVSNSPPDECLVKVPTGGRVKCIYYI